MKNLEAATHLRRRQIGQAAGEAVLIVALIVLVIVMLPGSAIEHLLLAIEGRYQAIFRYSAMP